MLKLCPGPLRPVRLRALLQVQGDAPRVGLRQVWECGHGSPANAVTDDIHIHPDRAMRWFDCKLWWSWRKGFCKWRKWALEVSVTEGAPHMVEFGSPLEVVGRRAKGRIFRRILETKFQREQSRGEAGFQAWWFGFGGNIKANEPGDSNGDERRHSHPNRKILIPTTQYLLMHFVLPAEFDAVCTKRGKVCRVLHYDGVKFHICRANCWLKALNVAKAVLSSDRLQRSVQSACQYANG
jgi:hypothetical protein